MTDWDARYDRPDYLFGEEPNAFLKSQLHRIKLHKNALAVADGEGRNGVWLAQQGLSVTSIDASSVALRKAEDLAARREVSITTRLVDMNDFQWPAAAYDLVVAIFIQFADPQLRDDMFAGMIRTLAPGGTLLMQGYRREQLAYGTGGPRDADHLYTEEMLRDAFDSLEIVELNSYDAEIRDGPAHDGMSALIDLVARKPE